LVIVLNTAAPLVANRGAKTRQLLGMKGAAPGKLHLENPLQLMKPITWIPDLGRSVRRGFVGKLHLDVGKCVIAACMLLSGPLLAGYTQTLNDFMIATLMRSTNLPPHSDNFGSPSSNSDYSVAAGFGVALP